MKVSSRSTQHIIAWLSMACDIHAFHRLCDDILTGRYTNRRMDLGLWQSGLRNDVIYGPSILRTISTFRNIAGTEVDDITCMGMLRFIDFLLSRQELMTSATFQAFAETYGVALQPKQDIDSAALLRRIGAIPDYEICARRSKGGEAPGSQTSPTPSTPSGPGDTEMIGPDPDGGGSPKGAAPSPDGRPVGPSKFVDDPEYAKFVKDMTADIGVEANRSWFETVAYAFDGITEGVGKAALADYFFRVAKVLPRSGKVGLLKAVANGVAGVLVGAGTVDFADAAEGVIRDAIQDYQTKFGLPPGGK